MRGLAAAQFAWALLVVSFNMARIAEFMHQRYKFQQKHIAEALPVREAPQPLVKPKKRKKVIQRRDREGLSTYKRNYVRRDTYVMTFDD